MITTFLCFGGFTVLESTYECDLTVFALCLGISALQISAGSPFRE